MIFSRLGQWTSSYIKNDLLPYWSSSDYIFRAAIAFLLLYLASIVNSLAGIIATSHAGSPVTDIFLSNIQRIDTSFIHGRLAGEIKDLTLCFLFLVPRYLPFAMKSAAILMIVRAFSINLTNVGMFPDAIPVASIATFGGDLFFSGHVAFAYLNSLVFWKVRPLRYLFLFISVSLGASALLGHYHYSVDVFAAPFITYGVYVICKKNFIVDYKLLEAGL